MNRLWIRLSLVFGAVIVITSIVIALTSNLLPQTEAFRGIMRDEINAPGGLMENLRAYYREHGSWTDITTFWEQRPESFWIGPDAKLTVSVLDADGSVLTGKSVGDIVPASRLDNMLPIVVDGVLRGYVQIERVTLQPPDSLNAVLMQRLSHTLLNITLIVAGISLLAGIVMSRSLTAPISRLAAAARAIGSRKQYQQVQIEGSKEVRDLAQAFNEMSRDLEQAERLRRNLVADVAHELRTPLTVLQGNLQAILDDVYPLSKVEINRLYEQTRLLGRLVNDLHELSQAEASQLKLNRQPFNLAELTADQVELFGSLAEQEGIKLTADLPAQPLTVKADAARLAQVLGNLISNALAHTPSGGSVEVSLSSETDRAVLTVQDSGEGIPNAHLPYIFERFYRVDSSRSRRTGGAGLGLAIARAFVEAHGGTISATSDGIAGKGSAFTIKLPL
ncbi:MAG: HAMP domain-containing protein [Anaerolineae bacterium]|nr:HAMP domain-containing protein [Anaerolineae bacterium]